jgi:hypothetical protein
MDKQGHINIRITQQAHKRLKLIAAMRGNSIVDLLDYMTEKELKYQKEGPAYEEVYQPESEHMKHTKTK